MKKLYLSLFLLIAGVFTFMGCSSGSGSEPSTSSASSGQQTATAPEVMVAPMALAYGDVMVGDSISLDITISNQGTDPLEIIDIGMGQGSSGAFAITGFPTDAIIGVGETDILEITYTPTHDNPDTGTIEIECNDEDEPLTVVALSGTGTVTPPPPAPEVEITPSSLAFGDVKIGESVQLDISISNTGNDDLEIYQIDLGQGTSSEFAITGTLSDMIVAPGETDLLEITFTPIDEGDDSGTVDIRSNDSDEPLVTIPLSGRGIQSSPPVVSSYEGFGAVTEGAKSSPTGYTTYHVTSLADSGSGTLRDAVSQGNRYIVFDVAGTITLKSSLNIPYSYITIDGASAPSPGITIVQPGDIRTTIEARSSIGAAHDIIIHHLRMDGEATYHSNDGDIWGLDGESAPVYNIILDHITAVASPDGCFDIWEDVHDVTISWNLITDTVTALHLSTGNESVARRRISIHHNVFARNNERQIRIRHNNSQIDFVNNVIYGWGWLESGSAGLHVAYDSGEINPSLNVINNVYHYVSGLSGDAGRAVVFERGGSEGDVYFSGNILPSGENDAVSTGGPQNIPAEAQVTLYDASTLQDNVVPHAGTHYPSSNEQQLLNTIKSDL